MKKSFAVQDLETNVLIPFTPVYKDYKALIFMPLMTQYPKLGRSNWQPMGCVWPLLPHCFGCSSSQGLCPPPSLLWLLLCGPTLGIAGNVGEGTPCVLCRRCLYNIQPQGGGA